MKTTLRVTALSLCMVGGVLASAGVDHKSNMETDGQCPQLTMDTELLSDVLDIKKTTVMINGAQWDKRTDTTVMPHFFGKPGLNFLSVTNGLCEYNLNQSAKDIKYLEITKIYLKKVH